MSRILIALACCFSAILMLAGCGDGGAAAGGGRGASKKLKIAISVPSGDHGWTAGVNYWCEQIIGMYSDVEWLYQKADNVDQQRSQVENMLTQRPDALVILCHESGPLDSVGKQAREQGVYVVSVDRGFTDPKIADVFVEGDNKSFGRKSAEYIVGKLGGQGNILVFEGITSTVNTDRVNGAMEVFKKYPGIKILRQQQADWNAEKAFNIAQNMLVDLANQQIDAIWAQDDDMAEGIERALKEAGRDKGLWILGGAGKKTIVKRVMDGDPLYPADITYPPSMIAVGMHLAVANLRDGQREKVRQFMPRHILIDVELILPENAKDYYFPDSAF